MLRVQVISPEKVLYEGEAASLVVPAHDGQLGILSGHAPMMTLLGKGALRLDGGAAGGRTFAVEGGFLQVVDDQVRVVTERASEG